MAAEGDVAGKVCVVTGGARGIGAAICDTLAAAGGRIAVLDRDEAEGNAFVARLRERGVEARFYAADITQEAGVDAIARQVAADFGGVDVLVNNAGISRLGPSMTFPVEQWRESFEVLVTGVFLCSRAFGAEMRGNGGSIINISSLNAIVNFPMRLAYSAAKAAVVSMTKVLAVEWAGYKIRVNAVAPGMIETEMLRQVIDEGLIDVDAYMRQMPLQRFGTPEEIAQTVLFLASPRSAYMTGQLMVIDGGFTAFDWIPWSWDPENPGIAK